MPELTPEKIADIVRRYRPRGFRVAQSRHRSKVMSGLCDLENRILRVPLLRDVESLAVFLHECAHIHLGHFKRDIPHYEEEWEAERYSFLILRAEGIFVPSVVRRAMEYRIYLAHDTAGIARPMIRWMVA